MHVIYDTPNLQHFITHDYAIPRQAAALVRRRARLCSTRKEIKKWFISLYFTEGIGVLGVCRPREGSATYGEGRDPGRGSLAWGAWA
ncbi:hypothetical protein E2C01_027568 [Portunus trituberculatus]|uniref:Uncharacterized protein n=1 Tax=Portunus trituberculatus TaxID=210409 RepID=A0A5B7ELN1_PORTR|nr:hypothetical protein [Portunus trituberculatus]